MEDSRLKSNIILNELFIMFLVVAQLIIELYLNFFFNTIIINVYEYS